MKAKTKKEEKYMRVSKYKKNLRLIKDLTIDLGH